MTQVKIAPPGSVILLTPKSNKFRRAVDNNGGRLTWKQRMLHPRLTRQYREYFDPETHSGATGWFKVNPLNGVYVAYTVAGAKRDQETPDLPSALPKEPQFEKKDMVPAVLVEEGKKFPIPDRSLIQRFIQMKMSYDSRAFPDLDQAQGEYATFDRIIAARRGGCREGFVVAASMLHKLGYEVFGLSISPMDPQPGEVGHMVAVYKDKATGLYGTAGINPQDYIHPAYSSLEKLAEDMALKCQFTEAKASTVEFSDSLYAQAGIGKVVLKKTHLSVINLNEKFGVFFASKDLNFGKANYECLSDGFEVSAKTTMEFANPIGEINGKPVLEGTLTGVRVKAMDEAGMTVTFRFNIDHRFSRNVDVDYNRNGTAHLWLFENDSTKNKPKSSSLNLSSFSGASTVNQEVLRVASLFTNALGIEPLLQKYGYDKLLAAHQNLSPDRAIGEA